MIGQKNYLNKVINSKNQIKKYIQNDNRYAKYALSIGYRYVKDKYPEVQVETTNEALEILQFKDIRELFGIEAEINEKFESALGANVVRKKLIAFSEAEKIKLENEHIEWDKETENKKNFCGHDLLTFCKKIDSKGFSAYIDSSNYYCLSYQDYMGNMIKQKYGIIDLYEIITKCKYHTAFLSVCQAYNIKIKRYEEMKCVCEYNRAVLNDNKNLKDDYPILYKMVLSKHRDKLLAFIDVYDLKIGIGGDEQGIEIKPGEVADYMQGKRNTLQNIIKSFSALGLVNVVDTRTYHSKGRKEIAYIYSITRLDKLKLEEIEQTCMDIEYKIEVIKEQLEVDLREGHKGIDEKCLKEVISKEKKKINLSKINEELCMKLFGQEITENIYRKIGME